MAANTSGRPACVYRLFDSEDRLLYVGSTTNLPNRLAEHKRTGRMREVSRVAVTDYSTLSEARSAESEAIFAEQPRDNVMGRDQTPEMEAWVKRTLDAREAAGLPRQIEDGPTLDQIAALVVAGRRQARNKKTPPGGATTPAVSAQEGRRGRAAVPVNHGVGDGRPTT